MPNEKHWLEVLLDIANRDIYERCIVATPKPAKKKVSVPDLSDNEFWDKGETTK